MLRRKAEHTLVRVIAIYAGGFALIWLFRPKPLDPQVEEELAYGAGTAPVEN